MKLNGNQKVTLLPAWRNAFALWAAWLKRKSRPAFTLLTVFLSSSLMAQATVMDSIGNYLYGGFTGPLAKAIAVVIFIISIIGIRHGEGRAFGAACVAAFISGAVLAAPLLVNEFSTTALSGLLLLPF
jgi:type IV secretory pathway VirB2 component (pilin)